MKPVSVELWRNWGSVSAIKVDEYQPTKIVLEEDDITNGMYYLSLSDNNHEEELIIDDNDLENHFNEGVDFIYNKDRYSIRVKF